eukprot:393782-Rhodomonas_salina.1
MRKSLVTQLAHNALTELDAFLASKSSAEDGSGSAERMLLLGALRKECSELVDEYERRNEEVQLCLYAATVCCCIPCALCRLSSPLPMLNQIRYLSTGHVVRWLMNMSGANEEVYAMPGTELVYGAMRCP